MGSWKLSQSLTQARQALYHWDTSPTFVFKMESHYVAQVALELKIPLPWLPEYLFPGLYLYTQLDLLYFSGQGRGYNESVLRVRTDRGDRERACAKPRNR